MDKTSIRLVPGAVEKLSQQFVRPRTFTNTTFIHQAQRAPTGIWHHQNDADDSEIRPRQKYIAHLR
jgi:hypothetical protein